LALEIIPNRVSSNVAVPEMYISVRNSAVSGGSARRNGEEKTAGSPMVYSRRDFLEPSLFTYVCQKRMRWGREGGKERGRID
jgi:hypothetical protein